MRTTRPSASGRRRSTGYSLIEVLVTMVVIAGGLLAHVGLQRIVFREANLSSGRVAATELALNKLEDLRAYTALYATTGQFAYQDIANNAGGSLASGTVAVDTIAFNRSWTVADRWYAGPNSAATATAPAGNPLPSYKLVTVTVAWTDQNGAAQSVVLPSLIAANEPARAVTMFR